MIPRDRKAASATFRRVPSLCLPLLNRPRCCTLSACLFNFFLYFSFFVSINNNFVFVFTFFVLLFLPFLLCLWVYMGTHTVDMLVVLFRFKRYGMAHHSSSEPFPRGLALQYRDHGLLITWCENIVIVSRCMMTHSVIMHVLKLSYYMILSCFPAHNALYVHVPIPP